MLNDLLDKYEKNKIQQKETNLIKYLDPCLKPNTKLSFQVKLNYQP